MKTYSYLFDQESKRQLAALLGQRWRQFGAASMNADRFTTDSLFFETSETAVTLRSKVEFLDVNDDGEDSTLAQLSVSAGADDLPVALKSGSCFATFLGGRVADVQIVRLSLVETRDGAPAWELTQDVGVVVILDNGVIAATATCLNTETLKVNTANQLESMKLPDFYSEWEERIGRSYEQSVCLIPVRDLLDCSMM